MLKKPAEPAKPDNFSRYVDPTGEFSNRDLKLGEWYVKHRVMLREIVITLLAIIIVVFGGYSLYRVIEYAFFGYRHDERVRNDLAKTSIPLKSLRASVSATPLIIDSVSAYPGTPGKYDFMAMVENQNDRWLARVNYAYAWEGGESLPAKSVVLPKTKIPLLSVGVPLDFIPDNTRLVIKSIDWQRLDNHAYPEPTKFVTERTAFVLGDFSFVPASPAIGSSVSQIKFTIQNNTAYGYWQVPFAAVLKKGDVVVGVKHFIVDSFAAGEVRPVELSSLVEGLDIDAIELFPDLDILDKNNYQSPKVGL